MPNFIQWGIETCECDPQIFQIQCARPMKIVRVTGNIAVAPVDLLTVKRSVLVSCWIGHSQSPSDWKIVNQPEKTNESVSNHLFNLIVKQCKGQPVVLPFDYSYDSAYSDDGFIYVKVAGSCLNAELSLTVYYE